MDRRAEAGPGLFSEEAFIREFPDAGGPPLEADLFEALRLAGVR